MLRETYAAITHVLGADEFDRLLLDYLVACPPHDVSIKYAAAGLPPHLARQGFQLLADLAALAWAQEDLFDAPDGPAPLAVSALAEVGPDDWERVRVSFLPAVRLVHTAHDVAPVLAAAQAGEPAAEPDETACTYLVHRAALAVAHERIDDRAAPVLAALLSGKSFGEACAGLDEATVEAGVACLVRCCELALVHALSLS